MKKLFGANHPNVATSLNNLAELYQNEGRYADAETLLKRSLAINEKARGSNNANVALSLNNLAHLYQVQARYAEAEPLFKELSLALKEELAWPHSPIPRTNPRQLGSLYQVQGRYADAEPLYKRALAINEKTYGPEHPDVAMVLNNLASLGMKLRVAIPMLNPDKQLLAIWKKFSGKYHPNIARRLGQSRRALPGPRALCRC